MEQAMRFEDLCPYVREAGMQRGDFWQIPRRIYDHEMMLCLSGTAYLNIAGSSYHLQPGQLAIIPPDTPHTLQYHVADIGELVWFHFDFSIPEDGDWVYRWYNTAQDYVRCFSDRLPYPEHIRPVPVFPGAFHLPHVVTFDDVSEVKRLFLSLAMAYPREQNHFMLLSRIAVLSILDAVLDQCGYWKHSEPIRVSDMMTQYIKSNYMNRITVQDVCACTQYHPDYAGKLFRQETGNTVIDYLNRFRINKAQTLLLDESMTVAAVAEKCGFQTVNYFSSVTKKITGMNPRALRAHLLTIKNDSTESK